MIKSSVPDQFSAGDTWRWTKSFADYAAPTWTITYYFENDKKAFSIAGVGTGTSHAFSIAAATTAGYLPGRYRWFAKATDGTIVETIDGENGWIEILPNIAGTGQRDHRSFARRALDAVEATIEGKATTAQQSFSIASRTVSSYTLAELWQLKKDLEAQVRAEESGSKAGLGRRIKIRFGTP